MYRRQFLGGAAATAILLPTVKVIAQERRHLSAFPGGLREALQQSEPFFVPAGVYDLRQSDGQIVLDHDVDMLGEGDATEIRPRGQPLRGGRGWALFDSFKIAGAAKTDALLTYNGAVGNPCGFAMKRVNAVTAAWVMWGNYEDLNPITVGLVNMEDCFGRLQKRALNLQGAVRHHSLTNITVEDYTEFGIIVGSGRRAGQLRMMGGTLKNVIVRRGTPNANSNNAAIWHGGRSVLMEDILLEDLPVPSGNTDTESLYTKVEDLTARRVTLRNAGGALGSWSAKGAHPLNETWEIDGRNVQAEDFTIENTVGGPRTAVWCQTWGECSFKRFAVNGMGGVAFRMHQNCDGAYMMEDWNVQNHTLSPPPSNPAVVFCSGAGTLDVHGCTLPIRSPSNPFYRNLAPPLSLTQSDNTLYVP